MSGFPLTKLPLVNIIEVMRMMDVSELLKLTSCTAQIQELARNMKPIKRFSSLPCSQKEKIHVPELFGLFEIQLMNGGFSEFLQENPLLFNLVVTVKMGIEINLNVEKNLRWYIFVEFSGKKDSFFGDDNYFAMDNQLVPCISSRTRKELYTFWDDKNLGMKTLVNWIRRTFYVQFHTLLISAGDQPGYADELRSIVNHVNCVRGSYTNVTIDEKVRLMEHDDLDFVRKNVTAHRKYYHLGKRVTPMKELNMEADQLLICHGPWFTYQHLLLTNCVFINVVDTDVHDNDLNRFVNLTLEGHFPRLKHITMKQPDVSVPGILVCRGNRRGYIRDGVYSISNNKTVPIRIGAVVENRSETRAITVTFSPPRRRLMTFEMFVWPDLEGNYFDAHNEIRPHGF